MENELAGKKLKYYSDSNTELHIKLLNGRFYNGIVKYIGADFLLLTERKLNEVCVFFSEIEDIVPYREEEKK
jgi:hypothetical protein